MHDPSPVPSVDAAAGLVANVTGARPMLTPENGRLNAPLSDPAAVTEVLVALREAGIGVAEMSLQKPSLDEVFLTLTGHVAEPTADLEEVTA